MEIKSAKIHCNGHTVNGNMWIPNDNPDHQYVLDYIKAGGIIEDEFTSEELTTQAQATARQKRIDAFTELSDPLQRHARETHFGLPLTDDIDALHTYGQQLADMTLNPEWNTDPISVINSIILTKLN